MLNNTANFMGSVLGMGVWVDHCRIGGPYSQTIPVEVEVDQALPSLGQELPHPSQHYVVIPRGRVVAFAASTLTRQSKKSVLTTANGVDPLAAPSFATGVFAGNHPVGYSPTVVYMDRPGLPMKGPIHEHNGEMEVPYTLVNEAYNTSTNGGSRLEVGELIMGYYGSTSKKTQIAFRDRGRPVRWVPRKMHLHTQAESATATLTAAPFPAFLPRIVLALNAAGLPIASGNSATMSYNETSAKWQAIFANAVSTVVFEYGAHESQIAGRIVGIEPIGTAGGINATSHSLPGWLQWVRSSRASRFDLWPMLNVAPTTSVTNEEVTLDSDNEGTLAHTPLVSYKALTVTVTGTLVDPDGNSSTLAGTVLSEADEVTFDNPAYGQYYSIDILSGRIKIAGNVTVTKLNVSYSYVSDYTDGQTWDSGIIGLTSGVNTIAGTPTHLDVPGGLGVMRVHIF